MGSETRDVEKVLTSLVQLGGKAPMVILKDANLEEACKAAAFGAMQHQGQICM